MLNKRLFILLVCCTWCFSWAQEPVYKNYTTEDGLPSNNLYFVHQSASGFIWIATERGLSKFNGYNFNTLTRNEGLPYNNIFEILEDVKQRLWIRGYGKEIVRLDKDSIKVFPFETIYEYANRYIRAFRLDATKHHIASVILQEGIIDAVSSTFLPKELDLARKQKESVYFSKSNKFLIHQPEKNVFVYKLICSPVVVRPSEHACLQLKSGHILLTEIDKLSIYYQKKLLTTKTFHDQIMFMRENDDGTIFLTFKNGGALEFENKAFNYVTAKNYLPHKYVTSAVKDKQGGRWFTTLGNGLYYLPWNYVRSFKTNPENIFLKQPVFAQHIQANVSKGLAKDKLLLFTREGKVHQASFPLVHFTEINDTKTELSHVYKDKNQLCWVACRVLSAIFNPYTNTLKRNTVIETTLIKPDDSGKRWVFGYTGLKIYPDTSNVSKPITILPHQKLTNMVEFQGAYFISGYEGLWKYQNDRLSYLGDKNPLLKARIDNMIVKDSVLYMSTRGKGILIQYQDTLIQVEQKQGLQENITTSLYVDNEHGVWVGSSKGVDWVRPTTPTSKLFTVTHITKDDGLLTNNVNDISGYQSNVYVCTDKGITFFDYKKMLSESIVTIPLYITQIKVNDHNTYAPEDSMVFSPTENTIDIQYIAISPRYVNNLVYRYRLQGGELGWVHTQNTNVRFPILPSGSYFFELQVKGSNGNWSESASTAFTIQTPMQETVWFRLLFVLACGGIVFLLVWWRIVQLKNKNALQEELNQAKRLALKSQMNPHFIFNSLNSIQKYIMEHDRKNASIYLSRFAMLVRKTLDYSEKEAVTLNEEIALLTTYLQLESLRFKNNFEYEIKCLQGIDVFHTHVAPLIIQPFIENAIWHGLMPKLKGEKKLSIHFYSENDVLNCLIKDNGIGREEARKLNQNKLANFTSVGIKITKKRLKLINKQYKLDMKLVITDLYNTQNQATGTQVLVTFPLNHKP